MDKPMQERVPTVSTHYLHRFQKNAKFLRQSADEEKHVHSSRYQGSAQLTYSNNISDIQINSPGNERKINDFQQFESLS